MSERHQVHITYSKEFNSREEADEHAAKINNLLRDEIGNIATACTTRPRFPNGRKRSRVSRGGAYPNYPGALRAAVRSEVRAGNYLDGFRLAWTLTP